MFLCRLILTTNEDKAVQGDEMVFRTYSAVSASGLPVLSRVQSHDWASCGDGVFEPPTSEQWIEEPEGKSVPDVQGEQPVADEDMWFAQEVHQVFRPCERLALGASCRRERSLNPDLCHIRRSACARRICSEWWHSNRKRRRCSPMSSMEQDSVCVCMCVCVCVCVCPQTANKVSALCAGTEREEAASQNCTRIRVSEKCVHATVGGSRGTPSQTQPA